MAPCPPSRGLLLVALALGLSLLARARPAEGSLGSGRALAVAGGGWRAYSVASATTAAMLHELARARGSGTLEGLFSNISTVSSNSGGSWFASSLIFSEDFVSLVDAMARDPESAGVIFNDTWTMKLLGEGASAPPFDGSASVNACLGLLVEAIGAASTADAAIAKHGDDVTAALVDACVARSDVKLGAQAKCKAMVQLAENHRGIVLDVLVQKVREVSQELGIPWLQDYFQAVYIFGYAGGISWEDIVSSSLQKTVNLGPAVTMGSEPQAWAKGKTWIACTSMPTPQPDSNASVFYYEGLNSSGSASYQVLAAPGESLRQYIPAHFSVVLGEGDAAPAPFPFCASQSCFDYNMSIAGVDEDGEALDFEAGPLGTSLRQAFTDSAGRLPVSMVAASSSAALAAGVLSPLTAWGAASGCFNSAAWVSKAPGGESFATAQDALDQVYEQVDEATVGALAGQEVHALFDGAYTDNTGIAWAVARGAAEVTAISNGDPSDIWGLGAGAAPQWGRYPFGGENFDIFQQSTDDIAARYAAMPKLQIPPGSSGLIEAIVWGSMDLTTAENRWFGIPAGRPVRLNVISVETNDVSMAFFTDYFLYGALVNDITSAFAYEANARAAQTILDEFYAPLVGSTQDQANGTSAAASRGASPVHGQSLRGSAGKV